MSPFALGNLGGQNLLCHCEFFVALVIRGPYVNVRSWDPCDSMCLASVLGHEETSYEALLSMRRACWTPLGDVFVARLDILLGTSGDVLGRSLKSPRPSLAGFCLKRRQPQNPSRRPQNPSNTDRKQRAIHSFPRAPAKAPNGVGGRGGSL